MSSLQSMFVSKLKQGIRENILNMNCFCCCEPTTSAILFISSLFYLLPIAIASFAEVGNEMPFTYSEGTGKGPKKWGHINPHWQLCDTGKLQSPIDVLSEKVQVLPNLGKLKRDYRPAPAVMKNRRHDITLKCAFHICHFDNEP